MSIKVFTPVEMTVPVQAIAELLVDAAQPVNPVPDGESDKENQEEMEELEVENSTENGQDATLSNNLPNLQTFQLLPVKTAQNEPQTCQDSHLLEALQMQTARLALAKGHTIVLQSQAVLQQLYANSVRTQLAAKEEKAVKILKKGKGKGTHLKDGLPCLLTSQALTKCSKWDSTGETYFQHIVQHEEAMKEREREKDARKKARESQAAEMVLWEQADQKRRERNEEWTHTWRDVLERYNADPKVAKSQGAWLKEWDQKNPKPKARDPQLAPEPMVPKPKVRKEATATEPEEEEGRFVKGR
ncbi:hypothetical protein BT96DRAFT_947595 [Gymnopus androsaceus JB14]|uniref:Uncharacterized protein n=1 Tax=Gymnopus androsaceus JB14 TaxID=1447944 RepID=A0A6A4GTK5_9AGAR|nr:hypothetical protein BT96DRAFT_947595 [Gymnopus androsaceus JB14]